MHYVYQPGYQCLKMVIWSVSYDETETSWQVGLIVKRQIVR